LKVPDRETKSPEHACADQQRDKNGDANKGNALATWDTLRSPIAPKDAEASRNQRSNATPYHMALTRIRLQFAIYFCLHKGKFAGKYGKLATLVKKSGQKRHKEQVERERIRYHLQPRKRTKGE
jgi:hypothetical protein